MSEAWTTRARRLSCPCRWVLVLGLVLSAIGSAAANDAKPLELPAAVALARSNSPALHAAQKKVGEARGEVTGASLLLPENPDFEFGAGPRLLDPGVSGNRLALEAGLSQRVEIGGQRGYRMGRAGEELLAAEAEANATARALDLAVATGFWQALAAAERAQIAQQHEDLARELQGLAQARYERGASTPVEVNGARIRLAEASRQKARAEAEARATLARLAPLLGLDPAHLPPVAGSLPSSSPSLPAITSDAAARRPDVVAATARARSARAAAELADAAAWPDVRLGVRYATEEASQALLGTIGIGIPVFQRNQGERERARAAVGRAEAEEQAARAQAEAEIAESRIELERTRTALELYDAAVLRALEENVALLKRTLEAGKIGPAEVIVLQRELLEGRVGFLDARLEAALAEARLRTAAGLPITESWNGGAP